MALDITTLASTDLLSDSRGDINTNFTNIKTDCALIDQSMYIGTTAVAINRASATLDLAGIGTLACGAITTSGILDLNNKLDLDISVTSSTPAIKVDINENSTENVTVYTEGIAIYANENITTTFKNSGYVYGAYLRASLKGAGDVTRINGMKIQYGNESGGTGTITTGIGLEILPRNAGGGTITTNYGLKINDMVGTTKYSIYTGTGDIQFGGLAGNAGHYVKVDANGKLYTEAT